MWKIIQTLLEFFSDAILIIAPDGRILKANHAACELLGLTEQQLVKAEKQQISDLTDPPLMPLVEKAQQNSPIRETISVVHHPEQKLNLEISADLCRIKECEPNWIVVMRDVTEEKNEEEIKTQIRLALEKEVRLKTGMADTILKNSQAAISVLDKNLRIVEFNPVAEKLSGLKREDVISRKFLSVFPEYVGTALEQRLKDALQGKITKEISEKYYLPRTARKEYFDTTIGPIRDTNGEVFSVLMAFTLATDRINTEQKLKESERRYRLLAENSSDVILVTDADGNYLYVSPSVERMTGFKPEEVVGTNIREHVHPEDVVRLLALREREVRIKTQTPIVYRRRTKSGSYKWVEATGHGLEDEKTGELLEFQSSIRDISDRIEMEQQMQRQRIFLDAMLNSIEDGILGIDAEGNFIYYNKAALKSRPEGYAGTNINYTNYYDRLFHPDSGAALTREEFPLYRALRGEYVKNMPVVIKTDHQKLHFILSATPLYDDHGVHLGAVAVARNVTAELEAQERLEKNQAILLKVQEITKIESLDIDLITREVKWSPGAYNLWGLDPTQKLTFRNILKKVHPDDLELVTRAHNTILESKAPSNVEYRIILPDGKLRWIWVHGTVYADKEGNPLSMLITGLDITEMKNIEEKLRRNNEQLQQANSELEQLLFTLSHDLKEPLRMIAVYSQLLISKCAAVSPEMQEYTVFMAEGLERMQDMLNELIAYEQAAVDGSAAEPVTSGIVLQKVIEHFRPEIEKTHAEIIVHPLPKANISPQQLFQLFKSLLSNSLKFMEPDVRPCIEISAVKDDGFWRFSIEDNGIGMNEAYHDKVFMFFKRLHPRDKYPGSGMGLPIAKKITENHGGKIWFNSVEGKGTTFYFTLPAVEENGKVEW